MFSTGNHSKIVPVTRIEDRHLQPGPVAKKARELYWDYARIRPPAALERPDLRRKSSRRVAAGLPAPIFSGIATLDLA